MSFQAYTPLAHISRLFDYPGRPDPYDPFPNGDPMIDDPSEEEPESEPDEWPAPELPEEPGPSPYPPLKE